MRIALDGREFVPGRFTGIARFLSGLIGALSDVDTLEEIILAVTHGEGVPQDLRQIPVLSIQTITGSFIGSELALSAMTKPGIDCFISPYPKLPLFTMHCPAIHTVHDVLDLTHSAYRKRYRSYWDKFRLKRALSRADLTWFDSSFSRKETETLVGFSGRNPRIRYLGLNDRFSPNTQANETAILAEYGLYGGYIMVIGNGLPHKNLGVLIENSEALHRELVFVGVSKENQDRWKSMYPGSNAIWLSHVQDTDLPVLLRNAFCLAQPSTAEGYGYPPLEAMACGVPAVISDIPILVETTGGCALSTDPSDSKGWLEIFSRLEEKQVYAAQVKQGLEWVRPLLARNAWEKHVADVKEIASAQSSDSADTGADPSQV